MGTSGAISEGPKTHPRSRRGPLRSRSMSSLGAQHVDRAFYGATSVAMDNTPCSLLRSYLGLCETTPCRTSYLRSHETIVRKCPQESNEPQISFEVGEVEYPDHDDALIILVHVTNVLVKRDMLDTDSSTNILYYDAFKKLGLTTTDLSPRSSTLTRFIGDSIVLFGTTILLVTLGQEPQSKTLIMTFIVVGLRLCVTSSLVDRPSTS
ncbi:hypothetical protein GW17_00046592 [Ensete ventricosum]|nr:hypothetical protein GW17_00046592 [Ensete ventricosum]